VTEIFDRRSGTVCEERQFADAGLRLLYGHPAMLPLVDALLARRWFSRLMAWPSTWRRSAGRIPAFVDDYGIDLSEVPDRDYASFADFFTRRLRPGARPIEPDRRRLIAPADAKLLAYSVSDTLTFRAKGFTYTVPTLLGRARRVGAGADPASGRAGDSPTGPDPSGQSGAAGEASPAWCLVFRLTVDDCHRYSFVDDCEVIAVHEVPGRLHTVGPWTTDRVPVLTENNRVVTTLATAHFGQVTVVEIGAMMVGRIVNHPLAHGRRGQEKGYFAYGGSTIVVLVEGVEIDDDIVERSRRGTETRVRLGEGIGGTA